MQIKKYVLAMTTSLMLVNAQAINIVTYNIANYNDHADWDKRINLLVDAIEATHADVVVMQEIRFDPDEKSSEATYENTAEQILRLLNNRGDFLDAQLVTQPIMYYPLYTSPAHNYVLPSKLSADKKSYIWEGMSIISKFPIEETGSVFLRQPFNCGDFNKRATQYVKISPYGQSMYLFNAHFALEGNCLAANIKETLAYISHFGANTPAFLMGDMNAEPDNLSLTAIQKAGFDDLWSKLKPSEKGFTYPSDNPLKRIDYIWANQAAIGTFGNKIDIEQIGSNAQDGVFPSDHLGLLLEAG